MNDLDMNYNFPLNGYITSPSIKTNDEPIITAEINNDDCCYIRYRERQTFRSLLLTCTVTLAP